MLLVEVVSLAEVDIGLIEKQLPCIGARSHQIVRLIVLKIGARLHMIESKDRLMWCPLWLLQEHQRGTVVLYGLVGTLDIERGRDVYWDGEDVLITDFLL